MMDFKKAWRVLQVLLLSQLRAAATARNVRSFIRRPLVLVVIDIVAFAGASAVSYYVGSVVTAAQIGTYLQSALITLPALMLGMILVFGLVLEVSGGSQFAASDTINWLPVSAGEYVLGSVTSLITYYSFIPSLIIGGTLPISYAFGLLPDWELMVVLSIFGMFISASVLEILRAVLNRFSSSFYKKGGRGAIAVRAIIGVALIVLVQILFYPTIYEKALGAISWNYGPDWFVPILWSSVSVAALISGQYSISASFAVLFLALTACIYTLAIYARSKYWVPSPAAIRISSASYTPSSRSSLLGFLTLSQLAIAKKDLRGLVRRREMQRLLALPAIFVVSAFVSASSGGLGNEFELLGFFIVTMAAFFISIASIGSEGKAVTNLFSHPLSAKDFIIGKGITPMLFSGVFVVIYYSITGAVSNAGFNFIAILLISALALVYEITLLGLLLGIKFPMFSESVRTSFMSQSAGLIGFPIALVLMGVSIGPLFYALLFESGFVNIAFAFAVTIAITCIAAFVIFRMLLRQARIFLSELPGQV